MEDDEKELSGQQEFVPGVVVKTRDAYERRSVVVTCNAGNGQHTAITISSLIGADDPPDWPSMELPRRVNHAEWEALKRHGDLAWQEYEKEFPA